MGVMSQPLTNSAGAPTSGPPADADTREKVFEKSYGEVLLFLKHQDDKINRVLTALAFLTTAGVTLYIFSRTPDGPDFPRFADSRIRIDDFFFASFIVGVAVSVALALVSLDPTSFLPPLLTGRDERKEGEERSRGDRSLLYYGAIARMKEGDWEQVFGRSDLRDYFIRSLHADTHRLSRRARHKVRRFGTANAFVQFAVVALALLGVTRLNHATTHGRWILVTAVLIGYALLPLVDYAYFWLLDFPDVRRRELQRGSSDGAKAPDDPDEKLRGLLVLLFAAPFALVATLGLLTRYRHWEAVTFALFGTVVLRLTVRLDRPGSTPWFQIGVMTAVTIGGAIWLWC
jgi:hypothetical protein